VYKVLPDGTPHHVMPFDDYEVAQLLKDLKYTEFIRFEVPIKPVPEPTIEVLQKAVKELKVAEEALYKGDYVDVLHTLRNIVLNHLTIEVRRDNQKERCLREELKNYILNAASENYRSLYEEAIKDVESILRAILRHMHKFVHEDTGKLIRAPLKEDVEYLYTTLLAVVKYLAQLITRWAKQSPETRS
jgi:DNA-binding protein Fis